MLGQIRTDISQIPKYLAPLPIGVHSIRGKFIMAIFDKITRGKFV